MPQYRSEDFKPISTDEARKLLRNKEGERETSIYNPAGEKLLLISPPRIFGAYAIELVRHNEMSSPNYNITTADSMVKGLEEISSRLYSGIIITQDAQLPSKDDKLDRELSALEFMLVMKQIRTGVHHQKRRQVIEQYITRSIEELRRMYHDAPFVFLYHRLTDSISKACGHKKMYGNRERWQTIHPVAAASTSAKELFEQLPDMLRQGRTG